MIDGQALRLLRDLPDDLQARGWEPSLESSTLRTIAGTTYLALYARPFDPGIDDEMFNSVEHRNDDAFVVVSSLSDSWEAARQEAIASMREADARRSDTV